MIMIKIKIMIMIKIKIMIKETAILTQPSWTRRGCEAYRDRNRAQKARHV
jgi:hypothetical protein